jgi:hypothetical protein
MHLAQFYECPVFETLGGSNMFSLTIISIYLSQKMSSLDVDDLKLVNDISFFIAIKIAVSQRTSIKCYYKCKRDGKLAVSR